MLVVVLEVVEDGNVVIQVAEVDIPRDPLRLQQALLIILWLGEAVKAVLHRRPSSVMEEEAGRVQAMIVAIREQEEEGVLFEIPQILLTS